MKRKDFIGIFHVSISEMLPQKKDQLIMWDGGDFKVCGVILVKLRKRYDHGSQFGS